MDGNKWSEIFGESGYLNQAAQLYNDGDAENEEYILMPIDQIIAYATIKLSQVINFFLFKAHEMIN